MGGGECYVVVVVVVHGTRLGSGCLTDGDGDGDDVLLEAFHSLLLSLITC